MLIEPKESKRVNRAECYIIPSGKHENHDRGIHDVSIRDPLMSAWWNPLGDRIGWRSESLQNESRLSNPLSLVRVCKVDGRF